MGILTLYRSLRMNADSKEIWQEGIRMKRRLLAGMCIGAMLLGLSGCNIQTEEERTADRSWRSSGIRGWADPDRTDPDRKRVRLAGMRIQKII